MAKNQNPPTPENPEGQKSKKQAHVMGEIAGGVCLASTMVSCLCLFLIAMVNLG